ncbi:MAG TPA: ABC transporter permease [Dehalococcoidia bacterium]|nr:ABC transporter permease [Dehalococcoidia bacterium]
MGAYLTQRLCLMLVTLAGITLLIFAILRVIPGGVETAILGDTATQDQFVAVRHQLGLDKPLLTQYATWLGGVLHGDLGNSVVSKRSISGDMAARLPVTLELGALALLVALLIAVPVGVLSAMRQDSVTDYAARSLAIAALSIPSFWLGTLVITFGARWFGYAPPLTYVKPWVQPLQNLQIIFPPAFILGLALTGTIMRLTRAQMLEVLRQDFIRTAWAKGLRERAVVRRHAVRNAAIPIVTLIGLQVPFLFGGTVVLEQIFSVPGMGRYLITAVTQRDFQVIQAVVLMIATVVVLSNLLVDLTYSLLDPRIRYG